MINYYDIFGSWGANNGGGRPTKSETEANFVKEKITEGHKKGYQLAETEVIVLASESVVVGAGVGLLLQ